MTTFITRNCFPAFIAAVLLVGCETAPPAPPPKPVPPKPVVNVVTDKMVLKEAIGLYNNGDYNDAIKRLTNSGEIWINGSKESQLTALKYLAFSYCVTTRQPICRQQFDKAFKLDPNFDLAPGEHGHPLWGPTFAKAKKEMVPAKAK